MTELVISERLSRAMRRYEKLVETSLTTTHAHKRIDSDQKIRAARAVLGPSEVAILDMAVLKGRSLDALAGSTKQPRINLERLLLQAAEKLAEHFDGPLESVANAAEAERRDPGSSHSESECHGFEAPTAVVDFAPESRRSDGTDEATAL